MTECRECGETVHFTGRAWVDETYGSPICVADEVKPYHTPQ